MEQIAPLALVPRDDGHIYVTPRAPQACGSCRRQKRKCDKVLPSCSLCSRMSRPCDYTDPLQQAPSNNPSANELAALQARLLDLESRLQGHGSGPAPAPADPPPAPIAPQLPASSNGYGVSRAAPDPLWAPAESTCPPALFLDIDCYKWTRMGLPRGPVDVPMEVLELLSGSNFVQDVAAEYFATIHPWFPMISKKRLNLGIWDGGADLALLFLAMKVIITPPVEVMPSSRCAYYTAAKRMLALLESSGTISLLYLQAMILVALYEYSHALYPAAWMTVGACSRYADILGLPSFSDSTPVLGQCTTWTEAEERRRVWWSIYILDRALSLGSKRRLAVAEPLDTDSLPADDTAWDEGDMAHAFQRPASLPFSEPRPPFARLCQTAMLITRATTHCQRARNRYRALVTASPTAISGPPSSAVIGTTATNNQQFPSPAASSHSGKDDDGSNSNNPAAGPQQPIAEAKALLEHISSFADTIAAEMDALQQQQQQQQHRYHPCLQAARSLLASAVVLVLDLYSCPENLADGPSKGPVSDCGFDGLGPSEYAFQSRAVEGLTAASRQTMLAARDMRLSGVDPRAVSPLVLDALYCGLAVFQWLARENGSAEMERGLADTRESLGYLRPRWRLAEEYMKLEKYHDATELMSLRNG